MVQPNVVCVFTEQGPCSQTEAAIQLQWPATTYITTHTTDPFAYGSVLRHLWRQRGELVVIEQDVVPPPGSIHRMLTCARGVCTMPIRLHNSVSSLTFGMIHFGAAFRVKFPDALDTLYAAEDHRYYVRRGWTDLPYDCPPAVLNRAGRKACLRSDVKLPYDPHDHRQWPTTHDWIGLDATFFKWYAARGYHVHVHDGQLGHLHDYTENPVGSKLPWQLRPYDPREWPAR